MHDRFPNAITIAEDLYDDDRLTSGGACFDMQWGQGYFKVRGGSRIAKGNEQVSLPRGHATRLATNNGIFLLLDHRHCFRWPHHRQTKTATFKQSANV